MKKKNKNKSQIITVLTIFLGYLKRNEVPGVTEDDLEAIVRTISLFEKHWPIQITKES